MFDRTVGSTGACCNSLDCFFETRVDCVEHTPRSRAMAYVLPCVLLGIPTVHVWEARTCKQASIDSQPVPVASRQLAAARQAGRRSQAAIRQPAQCRRRVQRRHRTRTQRPRPTFTAP
jgi:hypothetical protein